MSKNLQKERFDLILKMVKENDYVKYTDLEKKLNISIATIRRDVIKLETQGKLNRISGGIEYRNPNLDEDYHIRSVKYSEKKRVISKKASKYVKPNTLIYLDAGTTVFEIISYLKNMNVIVVTNGVEHINELIKNEISFILLGGEVKPKTKAIIGVTAMKQLEQYNFDLAFMGTNAVNEEFGFSTPDIEEAIIKEKAISKSQKAIVLADSTKLNNISRVKFADFKDAILITEKKENK
ncbi:DeoR/GlpR family DNA-binding transcription regulator [Streptobacillus moniliformis]|uniref:Transcriptional regulator, DeoR family n=1 Tax=Streptobacillus moniliformis (strain ATCC 14647 / DSM 12112 / NCTC 10651 / 9901) TaxID=519441 RepID=D1AWC7_STRM9|nr:DeoR/GlpR family DNA-binding transcription regulator [Streptobacillus moniliformis]ACZ00603.1 transcriptional regulator, DeoR family [Streptobacillus moniliformis DSM 12112]SQA14274.1 HTH-type transcriptional repressor glcR [Streptobacillus moniliformis]